MFWNTWQASARHSASPQSRCVPPRRPIPPHFNPVFQVLKQGEALPRQAPDRHRKFAAFRNASPFVAARESHPEHGYRRDTGGYTYTYTHTHTHTSRFTRNSADDRPFTLVHARSRSFTLVHARSRSFRCLNPQSSSRNAARPSTLLHGTPPSTVRSLSLLETNGQLRIVSVPKARSSLPRHAQDSSLCGRRNATLFACLVKQRSTSSPT